MVVTLCVQQGGLIPQFPGNAMPVQSAAAPLSIERVKQRFYVEVVSTVFRPIVTAAQCRASLPSSFGRSLIRAMKV
jgi:hypothetical protein